MTKFRRIKQIGQALSGLTTRFRDARQGNVAMIFAIAMPVLILLTFGGVDIHRASSVRANLQDALDAAALAAARSSYVTDEELTEVGLASLEANLALYPQVALRRSSVSFTLNNDSVVIGDAIVDVDALVANIVLPPYGQFLDDTLPVSSHSEVNRSSKNIEVALVLDVTGSMAGSRLASLKVAAKDLVGIVVQDVQTPYTTRMSIVPYSIGVNVGASRAVNARGATSTATAITGAAWADSTPKIITGATKANPVVLTSNGHGFANGDYVWVRNVNGMTQINNRAFRVANKANNTFQLQSTNGTNYNTYTGGGTVTKCKVSDCSIVITSNSHGLAVNDTDNGYRSGAYISGVVGMTQINNAWFQIGNVTANSFSIGVNGAAYLDYISGGQVICGRNGCPNRYFRATDGVYKAFPITTCTSERIGSDAYTDASPSTAKAGRLYSNPDPNNTNLCPEAALLPLTSTKASLTTLIDSLKAEGSTAGHIGLAWGWYTISPSFNGLWSSNAANPYSTIDTIKTAILMTDGDFNTNYCSGVLAGNATYGGNDRISSCNATNGTPYVQMTALCTAMKQRGIIIYTVGFQIAANSSAAQSLASCATSTSNAFISSNGTDLADDFAAIGRDITRLRISK